MLYFFVIITIGGDYEHTLQVSAREVTTRRPHFS
jgi:hypothetical protein